MTSSPPKRRRGGQPGNANALKHGLTSRRLYPADFCRFGVYTGPTTGPQAEQIRLYLGKLFEQAVRVATYPEYLVLLRRVIAASGILARFIRQSKKIPVGGLVLRQAVVEALLRHMLRERERLNLGPFPGPPPPDPG